MIIETKRLILRPFRMEDLDEYFSLIADEDIRKYVYSYTKISSKEDLSELVSVYAQGDFTNDFYYVICNKVTNNIIGAIIAVKNPNCILDVSYLIGKSFRNRGYLKEAFMGFINFLLNSDFFYSRLELITENDNLVSQHIIKSCGGKIHRDGKDFKIWRIKLDHFELL